MKYNKIVALVGQPNVGKSCIINQLTGAHAIISNYPGTTVEVTQGFFDYKNKKIKVIDTPGTYTLHSDTKEQILTQKILLEGTDAIINVVDSTNLARNLYFTLQLMDLEIPTVLVLNFWDEAKKQGIRIDTKKLSENLGVPVVPTIAYQGQGIEKLKEAILFQASLGRPMRFTKRLEKMITSLSSEIRKIIEKSQTKHPERALAIHLLEHDIEDKKLLEYYPRLKTLVNKLQQEIKQEKKGYCLSCPLRKLCSPSEDKHFLDLTCQERYAKSHEITGEVVTRIHRSKEKFLEKIEKIIDRPLPSIPILLGISYLSFKLITFGINYIGRGIEILLSPLLKYATFFLTHILPSGFISNTLSIAIPEGILVPLTIVMPAMFCVYIIMAILEDTGLLSRFAVTLNKILGIFGLQGQSIIPLLLGFGCRVPGVLATRTLPDKRQRIIASGLISIVIPCAATLGIIAATIAKFGVNILVLISTLVISFITLGLFLNYLLPGKKEKLILEVPPFRIPSAKNVVYKTWFRMKGFFTHVLPILLIGSIGIRMVLETNFINYLSSLNSITQPIWGIKGQIFASLFVTLIQRYLAPLVLLNMSLTVKEATIACAMVMVSVPCLPNSVILWKELGFKRFLQIFILGGALSCLIGIILNFIL